MTAKINSHRKVTANLFTVQMTQLH